MRFRTSTRFILTFVLLAPLAALPAAEFHVAINGSDHNPGTKERPFATITRARDAVRELKQRGPLAGSVEVIIHGGTYFLPETIFLTPQDSGTANAPIVYRAAEGAAVVLSGGERIVGPWKKGGADIWHTELSSSRREWKFRQLFVNGRREIRARFPNADAQPPHLFGGGGKKDSITVEAGTIKPCWGEARDAQVHVVPEWRFFNQIQTVTGVDVARSIIRLGPDEQHARIIEGSWFHIEGVREELDQPREWFLDDGTRELLYWPEDGRDPNRLEIIAPRLNRIFHFRGDVNAGTQVEHVHLRGLIFRHTTYTLGHIEARVNTDAAVMLENASRCRIEQCHFENIGGYGVWLHLDSCENTIDGNTVTDAGGGGVLLTSARFSYMDDSKLYTAGAAAAKVAPLRNRITRNHIHHCGQIRFYNSGVHLDSRPAETALNAGNFIAHNHIHDMPRNGIFAFRNQGGNIVEFNRIEQIMLATEDGGGIHFATMNQLAAPNLIANNLVANAWGWRQLPTGGRERHIARGVYLDWFTAGTRVVNNVIYNTLSGGLQFNAGDDNQFVNNVVVGDNTKWATNWMQANAQGTVDERNVVIASKTAPSPLRDPDHGDFTLVKEFSGYPEGFEWVDVSQMGTAGAANSGVTLSAMAREGGVLTWDTQQAVTICGPWKKRTAPGMWGLFNFKYLLAEPEDDASVTFTLPVRWAGLYSVRLNFPAHTNRATNVRVEVAHADGTAMERVDMRTFGFGRLLGRYRFAPDKPARVTVSTTGADGQVALEGVGFVESADASVESSRTEQVAGMIQAHCRLIEVDSGNEVRFKEVLKYLDESLERARGTNPSGESHALFATHSNIRD